MKQLNLIVFLVVAISLSAEVLAQCPPCSSSIQVIPGQPQQLTSPGWTNGGLTTPSGCQCKWSLSTLSGFSITFSFSFFYTSKGNVLTITDGSSGNVLQTCSGIGCNNLNSTSNSAVLTYTSSSPSVGFSLFLSAVQSQQCNCGSPARFTNTSLQIMSPAASTGGFNGKCKCVWNLGVRPKTELAFSVGNSTGLTPTSICLFKGNGTSPINAIGCCGKHLDCRQVIVKQNWVTIRWLSSSASSSFFGNVASHVVRGCDRKPCLRGACHNVGANDFQCQCPYGFTGKTCSLPACTFTITNRGSYYLQVAFSSASGASNFGLTTGSQNVFTTIADTFATFHAYLGSTTKLYVKQCSTPQDIQCTGTTIIGFKCSVISQSLLGSSIFYQSKEGETADEDSLPFSALLPQPPKFLISA